MKHLTGAVALTACAVIVAIISSRCLASGPRSKVAFDMVIVSDSESNAQGRLPANILDLMVPFAGSERCVEFEFYPRPKLVRADSVPPDTLELDGKTDYETLKAEVWEAMPTTKRWLGAEPEFADIVAQARRKLENVRPAAARTAVLEHKEDSVKDSVEDALRPEVEGGAVEIAFIVRQAGNADVSRYMEVLKAGLPEGAKTEVVNTVSAVSSSLSKSLCGTESNSAQGARVPGVLVMLAASKVVGNGGGGGGRERKPSADAAQYVRQGLNYISLAKGARGPHEKRENYHNAEASFTAAINAGGLCYANAYMNRGVVYALQEKPSLALRDLNRAVECDPEDATIRYNLAAVHSLAGDKDLSLEALDAALTRGFSDCDALRDDPDLKIVRRMPEYKRTLEKHKLFCF